MEPEQVRCVVFIDGKEFTATLLHLRRGKLKIVSDDEGNKYAGKIIDASDVIRCSF